MQRRQIMILGVGALAADSAGLSPPATLQTPPAGFDQTFKPDFAQVNDIRLHYVSGGTGIPVVLLHGYPQTWYGWRKVMPTLAQTYRVVAPDMRGLGESSRPKDGDYTKKRVAEDIYQLMQQLGYDRFFVAGQDMGGPVAYALTVMHPESVIKLVAIETGIPAFGLEAAMNPAEGGSWHFGFFAAPEVPELLIRGREVKFLTQFAFRSPSVYQQSAVTDADIAEYLRSYSTPEGMSTGFGYYRAFAQDRIDNRELGRTKLAMPVLAIGGSQGGGLREFTENSLR